MQIVVTMKLLKDGQLKGEVDGGKVGRSLKGRTLFEPVASCAIMDSPSDLRATLSIILV